MRALFLFEDPEAGWVYVYGRRCEALAAAKLMGWRTLTGYKRGYIHTANPTLIEGMRKNPRYRVIVVGEEQ